MVRSFVIFALHQI